jgi:ketosteroid isomerase-like protein
MAGQLTQADQDAIGRSGKASLTLTPKAGGNTIEDRGNCIWLWRRQGDGSWKVARAMWNSPQPMPAA